MSLVIVIDVVSDLIIVVFVVSDVVVVVAVAVVIDMVEIVGGGWFYRCCHCH